MRFEDCLNRVRESANKIQERVGPSGEDGVVTGEIFDINDGNAYIKTKDDSEPGVIPPSEISWNMAVDSAEGFLYKGDLVVARNVGSLGATSKYSLKRVKYGENKEIDYPNKGDGVHGEVVCVTEDTEIVVKIDKGVHGIVRYEEISWDKKGQSLERLGVTRGEGVSGVVTRNEENRLELSLKRNKENPWKKYSEVLSEDEVYDALVVEEYENSIIVSIKNGPDAEYEFEEEEFYEEGEQVKANIKEIESGKENIKLDLKKRKGLNGTDRGNQDEISDVKKYISEVEERVFSNQEKLSKEQKSISRRQEEIIEKVEDLEEKRQESKLKAGRVLDKDGTDVYEKYEIEGKPSEEIEDEKELVEHVEEYAASRGIRYTKERIANFYTCLKTDYLTILGGISGTGKSQLPRLFAEAIGGVSEKIPVRPNWRSDKDLLGYYNPQRSNFQSTEFTEKIIEANNNKDRLYIICLDEMNLSSPEFYFAQFISKLEEGDNFISPDNSLTESVIEREESRMIRETIETMHAVEGSEYRNEIIEKKDEIRKRKMSELEKYRVIDIPKNVRFVGTVNVDHTTEELSDKMIDRSNVIKFKEPDFSKQTQASDKPKEQKFVHYDKFKEWSKLDGVPGGQQERFQQITSIVLNEINEKLSNIGTPFGWRVVESIKKYVRLSAFRAYSKYMSEDMTDIFDRQIKQRVIPKMRTVVRDREYVSGELNSVLGTLNNNDLEESHNIIDSIDDQVTEHGYLNYWEL